MARRFNRLHPVHSTKHIVDQQGGTLLDTNENLILVDTEDAPVRANTDEVETGSHVRSIFLNVQCTPTSAASIANIYMYVIKSPGNVLTVPDGNKVGASDVKKFVLHQEMLMYEQLATAALPRTLFKGVIKIPGSYGRFGADDALRLVLYAPGVNFNWCVQCIYKEIR